MVVGHVRLPDAGYGRMIPWFNITFPAIPTPFGPLQIHMFGILVATGILVGSRLTQKRARELGKSEEQTASMITTVLICGFMFAHIFAVWAYQTFGPDPTWKQWLNPFGGLSSYGGFIGAVAGLFYWCKRHKQPVMPFADSLAYGLAIGWMFGRLGCFSAHDHPGRFTSFFLGVQYPEGARHDLGLYEAIWSAGMAILFWRMQKRGNQPIGIYVAILVAAYAPVRFCLDFLRATDVALPDRRYFGLTPAQYGSIAATLAAAGLWVWVRRQREQPAK
jgi:phosphatidylglycerol:prolipoprotein diacylglycerol transferase